MVVGLAGMSCLFLLGAGLLTLDLLEYEDRKLYSFASEMLCLLFLPCVVTGSIGDPPPAIPHMGFRNMPQVLMNGDEDDTEETREDL